MRVQSTTPVLGMAVRVHDVNDRADRVGVLHNCLCCLDLGRERGQTLRVTDFLTTRDGGKHRNHNCFDFPFQECLPTANFIRNQQSMAFVAAPICFLHLFFVAFFQEAFCSEQSGGRPYAYRRKRIDYDRLQCVIYT